MRRTIVLLSCLTLAWVVSGFQGKQGSRWYRGNTHTHTLWSDGDAPPEVAAAWYQKNGYQFLVLSDHNVLSEGERWFPISDAERSRLTPTRVEALVRVFGEDAVEIRDGGERREMRLKTLSELRARFEAPEKFLFIQGEEITASFKEGDRDLPVHVNALNLAELVRPPEGSSAREVMNAAVNAAIEQGERLERPILAHINHPNFGWGLSWEDVAHVAGDRFFEVYNGHRGVRSHGDGDHVSTEELWDRALTLRLTELGLGLLYGVATDDAHSYWAPGLTSIPGRGWVMVRAERLEAGGIVEALKRGDFYASSGVTLDDVAFDGATLRVSIDAERGLSYTTRFIGTRVAADGPQAVGEVLSETAENPAVFRLRGDELYVRAVVESSRLHPDPYAEGDREMAWIQPVVPAGDD